MAHVIKEVEISKNPVNTGETFKLTVDIITWEYLSQNYTWASLQNSGMTWNDLNNKGE